MVAFFQNAWAWINSHAAVIAGGMSVADLVLMAIAYWNLYRQKKALYATVKSSKDLQESLKNNRELREEVSELKSLVAAQNEQIAALRDGQEQTNTKLNCVLEVQQQAYSVSLAKTQTLDAINGIIANGKYAETHARKAITDEVAELREQMEKLTAATKASEEKVKRIAGVGQPMSERSDKGVRYD